MRHFKHLGRGERLWTRPGRMASVCPEVQLLEERINPGGGTFQSGAFNFCVSVRFNATAAQLAQIQTAFQNGSQILADATDGQHRFGEVTLVNDSGASQSAEFWVNSGAGRAYATYGQYGVRGQHVNLFFDSDFQGSNGGPDGDSYTVAHEMAHHVYGLGDEYSGPADPNGTIAKNALVDSPTLNYSLMDNYFSRGGRASGGGYTLNEFSVPSNHDLDDPATPYNEANDTYQSSINNNESDWTTIAKNTRFPATAPAGLPVDAAPAAQNVTFKNGLGGLRVMLLLDHSGSMSTQQRIEFARSGSAVFTRFVQAGDGIGVASFDDTPTINFPLTTVVDASTRSSAIAAINGIAPAGSTNIGGGLLAALSQITAQADRSCNEIIVLLSDGDHNTGTSPAAAISRLKASGVTVFTVGVGTGISSSGQATLQDIAKQTGGSYFAAANSADLNGLFLALSQEAAGNGRLARAPLALASGQVAETPILVEAGAAAASFSLTLANPNDEVALSLRSPSGRVYTLADVSTDPNVTATTDANLRSLRIANPEAGTWSLIATAGTIAGRLGGRRRDVRRQRRLGHLGRLVRGDRPEPPARARGHPGR